MIFYYFLLTVVLPSLLSLEHVPLSEHSLPGRVTVQILVIDSIIFILFTKFNVYMHKNSDLLSFICIFGKTPINKQIIMYSGLSKGVKKGVLNVIISEQLFTTKNTTIRKRAENAIRQRASIVYRSH